MFNSKTEWLKFGVFCGVLTAVIFLCAITATGQDAAEDDDPHETPLTLTELEKFIKRLHEVAEIIQSDGDAINELIKAYHENPCPETWRGLEGGMINLGRKIVETLNSLVRDYPEYLEMIIELKAMTEEASMAIGKEVLDLEANISNLERKSKRAEEKARLWAQRYQNARNEKDRIIAEIKVLSNDATLVSTQGNLKSTRQILNAVKEGRGTVGEMKTDVSFIELQAEVTLDTLLTQREVVLNLVNVVQQYSRVRRKLEKLAGDPKKIFERQRELIKEIMDLSKAFPRILNSMGNLADGAEKITGSPKREGFEEVIKKYL
jgi:hypothetical protein